MSGPNVNPGTGPVEGGDEARAIANARQLLADAGLEGEVSSAGGVSDGVGETRIGGGRHGLVLAVSPRCSCGVPAVEGAGQHAVDCAVFGERRHVQVEMPGLPLEEVRPTPDAERKLMGFPRLYVDGASWWWWFAVEAVKPPAEDDWDE